MDQYTVPAIVPPATSGNLSDLVADRAANEPSRITLSRPLGDGWQGVTAKEFDAQVREVAKGLMAANIGVGDRIAIMAKTRYEWTVLDFAIWYAGAVSVPIYETSSSEQVEWILSDSGAVAIIVETPAHREVVNPVITSACKSIWTITDGALDEITKLGQNISDADVETRRRAPKPESLATLIYTSGTTGKPKGVQLTHQNFLSECGNVVQGASDLFLKPGGSTLLFLPVAHVFGRMVEVGAITAGLHLAHCGDITRLAADLGTFKPTFVLAVPRIFEKIYNGAEAKADAAGKGSIFRKAADIAIQYSEAQDSKKL
ncbi:MAG: AMP-binding protein, partial [Actinomycetes bacterium]